MRTNQYKANITNKPRELLYVYNRLTIYPNKKYKNKQNSFGDGLFRLSLSETLCLWLNNKRVHIRNKGPYKTAQNAAVAAPSTGAAVEKYGSRKALCTPAIFYCGTFLERRNVLMRWPQLAAPIAAPVINQPQFESFYTFPRNMTCLEEC